MTDLLAALGLVLVIEGALWAVAPDRMLRVLAELERQPPQLRRVAGLAAAIVGVGIVWLARG